MSGTTPDRTVPVAERYAIDQEAEPMKWLGWWGDGDQDDPAIMPWETFHLMARGNESGDERGATEDDLLTLGFVRIAALEPERALRERAERLETRLAECESGIIEPTK